MFIFCFMCNNVCVSMHVQKWGPTSIYFRYNYGSVVPLHTTWILPLGQFIDCNIWCCLIPTLCCQGQFCVGWICVWSLQTGHAAHSRHLGEIWGETDCCRGNICVDMCSHSLPPIAPISIAPLLCLFPVMRLQRVESNVVFISVCEWHVAHDDDFFLLSRWT